MTEKLNVDQLISLLIEGVSPDMLASLEAEENKLRARADHLKRLRASLTCNTQSKRPTKVKTVERVFLSNGNTPLTTKELTALTGLSALQIQSAIAVGDYQRFNTDHGRRKRYALTAEAFAKMKEKPE